MNNEFKKVKSNQETRYVLETATAGATGTGSIATSVGGVGKVQKRNPDNILAQEADTIKVPVKQKPRQGPLRQQTGAGAHRDKKKEQKHGKEKHRKPFAEDHEIQMAGNELKSITSDAMKLLMLIKRYSEMEGLEAWQQSKITKAADYLNSVLQSIGGEQGVAEGRHGYDDAGFSLAPGHDEGEPVYNPRYDRTGQYDRKAKYSQDYDYRTGKPLGGEPKKKGYMFYNVSDEQTAQKLGLKQTKSGKWYLPADDKFRQQTADKVFGRGRLWEPKQEEVGYDDYMESLAQNLYSAINEKAVSKAQQRFMGMVHAAQKGEKPASKEVAKVAKGMGKKDAKDFASTKHKGLPEKKPKK